MPVVECPITNCNFTTADLGEDLVKTLLNMHFQDAHSTPQSPSAATNAAEKIKRPSIEAGGNAADWTSFVTRWNEYVEATNVTGKAQVLQLLECCNEQLRRAVTTSAGGSLMEQ